MTKIKKKSSKPKPILLFSLQLASENSNTLILSYSLVYFHREDLNSFFFCWGLLFIVATHCEKKICEIQFGKWVNDDSYNIESRVNEWIQNFLESCLFCWMLFMMEMWCEWRLKMEWVKILCDIFDIVNFCWMKNSFLSLFFLLLSFQHKYLHQQ
jgi:hypothetical protein